MRSHRLPAFFLVLVVCAVASASTAGAATFFVRTTGDDANEGTSAEKPFKTLTHALHRFNHGDSIVVGPGTYKESVLLAERFGVADGRIALVGDESGTRTGDKAGPVILQSATPSDPALKLHRVQFIDLSGITFKGPGPGLRLEHCRQAVVARCTFDGNASGLSAESCQGLRVESCEFKRCVIGMGWRAVHDGRIAHVSVVGHSSVGVMLVNCSTGTIRNSLLAGNNTNYVADEVSAASWTSDHNVLTGTTGTWGEVPIVALPHEWFAASGQDRHSVYVAPAFADAAALDLRIDPLVNWGGGLPGQCVGVPLVPAVEKDRAGQPFRERDGAVCCGAFDYPDPKPGEWKPLPVNLKGEGPRQSAGVYKPDGTLLRMLIQNACGIRELWWDGRDDEGRPVDAGACQVRYATHDVRVADDGSIGDNGSAAGSFNCDNPESIALLPDGRFVVATSYDEAGIPLRLHASTGQPVAGLNLAEKAYTGLVWDGAHLIGTLDGLPKTRLVMLDLPGARVRFANGAEAHPLLSDEEAGLVDAEQKAVAAYRQALKKYENDFKRLQSQKKPTDALKQPEAPATKNYRLGGLAVRAGVAYVALGGFNLVRRVDLATGKRLGDWPLAGVEDLALDENEALWAVMGKEVVSIDSAKGEVLKRFPTELEAPAALSANGGKIAVADRKNARIQVLRASDGGGVCTLGRPADLKEWQRDDPDVFSQLRDVALYPDGRLLVTEHLRLKCIWPERKQLVFEEVSTFLDISAIHPTHPEYVYNRMGIYKVDEKTGAWTITNRAPAIDGVIFQSFLAGGRAFIATGSEGAMSQLWDVTEPENPRFAGEYTSVQYRAMHTKGMRPMCVTKDLAAAGLGQGCSVRVAPFKGLDEQHNPVWDYEATATIGQKDCPDRPGFFLKRGLTSDPKNGDFYALAVTERFNQMVPMWGADGTGVGKLDAEGHVKWFVLSSGNNYQSITSVHDGKNMWVMACKSFGGQIDLFDPDGLLLGTGNWGWLNNHQMGFVDMLNGCTGYQRADGKPGVYVEDDLIGRFTRARVDGAETVKKQTVPFDWAGGAAPGKAGHVQIAGPEAGRGLTIPKVQALAVNGDWKAWEAAGISPQVVVIPTITWGRLRPPFLLDTYRTGTYVAAFAHDKANLYVYLLTTDDTPHFDATTPGMMWAYDSFELWIEQEQFGLGYTADGKVNLHKYRFHNREGKDLYNCNYGLDASLVWGQKLADVSTHPLGRVLGNTVGRELTVPGYAMMIKIPFEEMRLVGGMVGVAGREGAANKPVTGTAGEILRMGFSYDGIETWGREQDFKVSWPNGLMYSDPTRSYPFVFGE